MPTTRIPLVLACLLTACAGTAPAPQASGPLAGLAFLAGTWVGEGPGTPSEGHSVWEAHYTAPSGDEVLGMSKEYLGGTCRSIEFERFTVQDGKVVVIPFPGGRPSVPFTLATLEPGRAVFENPKHDFPQRLDYRLDGDDTLVIEVTSSGSEPDKRRGFRFVLKRLQR